MSSGHAYDRPPTNPLRNSVRSEKRYSGNYPPQQHQQQPQQPQQQQYHSNPQQHVGPSHPHSPGGRRHFPRGHHKRRPLTEKEKYHRKRKAIRGHFVAAVGEYIGTIMFLWLAFAWHQTVSVQTAENTLPGSSIVLYISLGYGFSLLVSAFAFYRISGGLFNPAVTLGMVVTGALPVVRGIVLLPTQLLGGITAAALVSCMFPGPIAVTETTLQPGVSIAQGVFIEAFGTAVLVFTILMLAAEKSKVTYLAPLGIGLALFVAELASIGYTGGSINPARSLGPAVAARSFPGYFWIYVIGPFLGSLLAGAIYKFNTAFEYQAANPGQDSEAEHAANAAKEEALEVV